MDLLSDCLCVYVCVTHRNTHTHTHSHTHPPLKALFGRLMYHVQNKVLDTKSYFYHKNECKILKRKKEKKEEVKEGKK